MAQETITNNLEYLSLSKLGRIGYKISHFFTGIPKKANKRISPIDFLFIFRHIAAAFLQPPFHTSVAASLGSECLQDSNQHHAYYPNNKHEVYRPNDYAVCIYNVSDKSGLSYYI